MAKYILESHPKRTNVASLTGLDLVTFWWNQVCFLLSYQRAQALFDRNHAMRSLRMGKHQEQYGIVPWLVLGYSEFARPVRKYP